MVRIVRAVLFVLTAVLALPPGTALGETLKIAGVGGAESIMRQIGAAFSAAHPNISVEIVSRLGGTGSIKALAAGAIHVSVTGRRLSEQDRALAPMVETEFLQTPLLFATNNRSAASITEQEIVEIYAGRQRSWPDNTPIRPIVREATESDVLILAKAIPNYGPAMATARARPELPSAGNDLVNAARALTIEGSLTAITLLQMVADRLALQPLRLDGVEPTVENLAAGRYPLNKRIHLVVRQDAPPAVRQFLAFLLNEEVRRVLNQNGAIALMR